MNTFSAANAVKLLKIAARGKARALDLLRSCNELTTAIQVAEDCGTDLPRTLEPLLDDVMRHNLAHASVCGAVLTLWGGIYHVRQDLVPMPSAAGTIVAVTQRHIAYPDVVAAGCAALAQLAFFEATRQQMLQLGAARLLVDLVCELMKSDIKLRRTMQAAAGFATLTQLCSTAGGALALVEGGVLQALAQAVRGPEVAAMLLTNAGGLVCALAADETAARLLVRQGLYSRVIRVVLRDYGSCQHSEAIVRWCDAVSNVFRHAVVLPQLAEPSVLSMLLQLLRTHLDGGFDSAELVLGPICSAVAMLAAAAARGQPEATATPAVGTPLLADAAASASAPAVGCPLLADAAAPASGAGRASSLPSSEACGGAGAQLPLAGAANCHHDAVDVAIPPAAWARLSAALRERGAFEQLCGVLIRYPADELVAQACCTGMASILELPLTESDAEKYAELAVPALLGVAVKSAAAAATASPVIDMASASNITSARVTSAVCKLMEALVDKLSLDLCSGLMSESWDFMCMVSYAVAVHGRHVDSSVILSACKAAVAIGKRRWDPGADSDADYSACRLLFCAGSLRKRPPGHRDDADDGASLVRYCFSSIHELLVLNPPLASCLTSSVLAVQRCVEVIRDHRADAAIVAAAASTLDFLLARAPSAPDQDPLTLAVKAGGVAAVSAALACHIHDADLAATLCRVLVFNNMHLLPHSYNALGLDGDGKLASIVASAWQVLQLHPEHELANAFACALVGFEPAQRRSRLLPPPLLPEGAEDILLRQLRLYAHNAVHIGFVCTAVRRACSIPSFRQRLVGAGVVHAMVSAAAAHAADYDAALHGGAAIARLYEGTYGDSSGDSSASSRRAGDSAGVAEGEHHDDGVAEGEHHDDTLVMCNVQLQELLPVVCDFLVAALQGHTPGHRPCDLPVASATTDSVTGAAASGAAAAAEAGASSTAAAAEAGMAATEACEVSPLAAAGVQDAGIEREAAAAASSAEATDADGSVAAEASSQVAGACGLQATVEPVAGAAAASAVSNSYGTDTAAGTAAGADAAAAAAVSDLYGPDVLRDVPADLPVTAAQACVLAMCNIAAEPVGRAQLHRAGAAAAVADFVRAFELAGAASAELLEVSYRALRNLAAGPVDPAARRAMLTDGCVDVCLAVAVAATGPDQDDASAQSRILVVAEADRVWPAFGTLFGLACEPSNCAALLQQRVAHAALASMRRHVADWRICWACCGVLLRLGQCAAGSGAASEQWLLWRGALDEDAARLIREVLSLHDDQPRVVRAAAAVLALLSRLEASEPASSSAAASVSIALAEPDAPHAAGAP